MITDYRSRYEELNLRPSGSSSHISPWKVSGQNEIRRNRTVEPATSFGYLLSGYINLARVSFSNCTTHCYNIHRTEHSSYVDSLQIFHLRTATSPPDSSDAQLARTLCQVLFFPEIDNWLLWVAPSWRATIHSLEAHVVQNLGDSVEAGARSIVLRSCKRGRCVRKKSSLEGRLKRTSSWPRTSLKARLLVESSSWKALYLWIFGTVVILD
jgi:hypothetical protein